MKYKEENDSLSISREREKNHSCLKGSKEMQSPVHMVHIIQYTILHWICFDDVYIGLFIEFQLRTWKINNKDFKIFKN